jgi:hypothetical protein
MRSSKLYRTTHVPLDGADARDLEIGTTAPVWFVS